MRARWSNNRSFFFYFLIAASLIILFLVVMLSVLYTSAFRRHFIENIQLQSSATVEAVNGLVEAYIQESAEKLSAAGQVADNAGDRRYEELSHVFEYALLSDQYVKYFQALGPDGIVELVYPADGTLVGTDASGHRFFREGIEADGPRWWGTILSSQTNEPVITVTAPYSGGLLIAQISLIPMLESLEAISSKSSGEIALMDKNGIYLLHSRVDRVRQREISPFLPLVRGREDRFSDILEVDGERFVCTVAPVPELDGHIILYQPYAAVQDAFSALIVRQSLVAALILLLAVFLAYISGKFLLRPILKTEEGINRIGEGDYSYRFEELPFSEFNKLILSINSMASRIQQRQEEIEAARAAAEEANRTKDRFIANMSHELRTPLNGIAGMTSLLLGSVNDPDHTEKLELVKVSVDMISQVVGDILDYALIERQELKLHRTVFSLGVVCDNLIRLHEREAERKNLQLKSYNHLTGNDRFVGDPVRIAQVLTNLLTNAIKFTGAGTVELNVHSRQSAESRVNIEFVVRDSGIGIPPDEISRIFERFTQLDDSTTKEGRGIGLGLAISRDLVRLMGGTITVESAVGEGSVFTVVLPLEIAAEELPPQPPSRRAPDEAPERTLLIAEDEAINRMYLKRHLTGLGYTVAEAVNGEDAWRMALELRPDLVLLDISMPVMDGWAAIEKIRSFQELDGIPVIALTAHAQRDVMERCLQAGMDGFISKPINEAVLDGKIASLLSTRS